ncbi:MAG: hypothetical protein AUH29_12430 [Candidatus Rokubacteria bacterium 13_1_40CM_69_27]|nr:MAG: hypothetical protein AUH29_12430 [Candidatus Rokubacteria bacterium 13_1_40CM_69_27]OLC33488.1 MAG: hypothetical protein AUH81_14130 [Candidatus Rokubacteria bacterium 13_1_40CM_4_69_5]OLE39127.1 MAG: hypothetical protein AUG00_03395 [Candidatus Rokubacteria bacterium 13_1_20CM_2_70_7]
MSKMSLLQPCRFLPILVLCCALDLAVPVAPTPTGVEFEEDEEGIHVSSARAGKPKPAALKTPGQYRVELRPRVRLSRPEAPARSARPDGDAQSGRARLSASDRAALPAPSGEDH